MGKGIEVRKGVRNGKKSKGKLIEEEGSEQGKGKRGRERGREMERGSER